MAQLELQECTQTMESAHDVLGVRPGASREDVKARFRELARKCHPDAGGRPEDFVRVTLAYERIQAGARRQADPGFGARSAGR